MGIEGAERFLGGWETTSVFGCLYSFKSSVRYFQEGLVWRRKEIDPKYLQLRRP